MGGADRPCNSQGCRDNMWNKATASTPVRPYSSRQTTYEVGVHRWAKVAVAVKWISSSSDCSGFDRYAGATSDPIRVAGCLCGMAERDRLIYRYGPEKVEKCENAWGFLVEAM